MQVEQSTSHEHYMATRPPVVRLPSKDRDQTPATNEGGPYIVALDSVEAMESLNQIKKEFVEDDNKEQRECPMDERPNEPENNFIHGINFFTLLLV